MTVSVDTGTLLAQVKQGDRNAFADLYDVLAPLVFGAVKRVLRDPAMSEEVTQEVFVEIWKSADRFDPTRAKVSTWAVTIARRRAVDRVRHEQSQRNRVEQLAGQASDHVDDTGSTVVAALDADRVSRAVALLPADQREVIELTFLDGLAHGAVAERLGLPLGTVKGRVRGGLRNLRKTLGDPT